MATYPVLVPPAPPRRRSTLQTILIIVAICAAAFCLLGWIIFHALSSSEAARMAMEKVQSSQQAVQLLGAPIKKGWLVQGSINAYGSGSGHAELAIPVLGSRNSGKVYVVAEKRQGEWSLTATELEVAGRPKRVILVQQTIPAEN